MSSDTAIYRLRPDRTIPNFLREPIFQPHPVDANIYWQLYNTDDNAGAYINPNDSHNQRHFMYYNPRTYTWLPNCENTIVFNIEPVNFVHAYTLSTIYTLSQFLTGRVCAPRVIRVNQPTTPLPGPPGPTYNQVRLSPDATTDGERVFHEYFFDPALLGPPTPLNDSRGLLGLASNDWSNIKNPFYLRRKKQRRILWH